MAKGYNHHNHKLTKQSSYNKRTFLPLLCRASINDVKLPADFKDHSFSSFSGDPSSPKVSCMGQIKRNRKLFTTPYKLTTSSSSSASIMSISAGKVQYTPQKNLYSSQTFPTNVITGFTTTGGGRGRREMRRSSRRSTNDHEENNDQTGGYVRVNLKELDPPLPVAPPTTSEENLWSRRRSGGIALECLKIQHQMNFPNKICNNSAPIV